MQNPEVNMNSKINADELAVIALGGNLAGDYPSVEAALQAAVDRLHGVGFEPVAVSRWWRSAAWPDPSDPPFLNGVVLARTAWGPLEALEALHLLEERFGRRRASPNAPRTLDLDLIAFGRRIIDEPGLILPHPRAAERYFVMGPLAEIAPHWRHPVLNAIASALAEAAVIGRDAVPL
jgi:2-amino-4-hydroxy-6-hydroxymethyldihydropteridine diphosphokinase